MSEYDYDSRRGSERASRYREPEYVSETTYIQRGTGRPSQDLVYRGREDSIEDIPRDFPPTAEYRRTRIRDEYPPRRGPRSRYDEEEDYYSDNGYARSRAGGPARRRSEYYDDDYYSDDYGRPRHERRKSKFEETLEDLGLGGAAAAILGKSRSKSRSRRGSEYEYESRDGSKRPRGDDTRKKWQQAAKAAVITGVIEAVRSRNEPGGWTGAKGQRVATAALGAAGVDGLLDRDPEKHAKRHIVESVVGGLAANRLANGPRSRSGSRGRSRSRSRSTGGGLRERSRSLFRSLSRGRARSQSRFSDEDGEYSPDEKPRSRSRGLKQLVAAGGIAAAGKAIYDRVRSKSRGRARSASVSSQDSYVPARRQRYGADRGGPPPHPDSEAGARGRAAEGAGGGELTKQRRSSSSESLSTTDMENKRKKMRGKELLTAGLATVATIHAAHGVYSSMVASEKRHKLVMEGEMSPEEARKRKSKNMLQDAAAVGIAALGIKSAFSEWKEMSEHRQEAKSLDEKRRKRRKMREREDRERRRAYANGAYGYPAPMNPYPSGGAYADGNPYGAAQNLPPPPMGAQPYR